MAGAECKDATAALVTGEIVISDSVSPFRDGVAHIYLEDISFADAEALVVAEAVIPNIDHPSAGQGDTTVAFALYAEPGPAPVNPRNDYAVRVWVDRVGDGKQGSGDLYNDQSYRVLTNGFGRAVRITLTRH